MRHTIMCALSCSVRCIMRPAQRERGSRPTPRTWPPHVLSLRSVRHSPRYQNQEDWKLPETRNKNGQYSESPTKFGDLKWRQQYVNWKNNKVINNSETHTFSPPTLHKHCEKIMHVRTTPSDITNSWAFMTIRLREECDLILFYCISHKLLMMIWA